MDMPDNFKDIDKAIAANVAILKKGRPTYTPKEMQFARDMIAKLNKRKAEIDYEQRRDKIAVVEVDQPRGNSSYLTRGRRFNVNPDGGVAADI